jgi:hypothetical protein
VFALREDSLRYVALALPRKISFKIISEAAGYISFTPVARQELEPGELVERILAVTGKRLSRIRDILSCGSFVSGNSRYRWEAFEADSADLQTLLDRFPDEDPSRPFHAAQCDKVVFQGRRGSVELESETASRRRLFQRTSFWEVLLESVESAHPEYQRYSYSDQADVYHVRLPPDTLQALIDHTNLLKYRGIAQELRVLQPDAAELFVKR